MSRLSIRWRMTIWCGLVLATILAASDAATYFLMRRGLLVLTDAALGEELSDLEGELGRAKRLADLQAELAIRFASHDGYEFLVTTPEGKVVFRSDGLRPDALPVPRPATTERVSGSITMAPVGHVRLASRTVRGPEGPLVAETIISLAQNDRALGELVTILLATGPVALAGSVVGGYLLARQALKPVDDIAAAAIEITASRLDRRLRIANPGDELGRLAKILNAMIERLERSFEEVKRFTADAAHELRTPLSMLRTTAEVALRSPRSPDHDRRVLEDLLEEVERLGRLVDQLLFLSREDVRVSAGPRQAVRLDDVACEVVGHVQVMAQDKGVALELDCPRPTVVMGDRDRLRQLFFNLLDNAVKYTPPGGRVIVRDVSREGRAEVVVADDGAGIAAEHIPHVFERFYRIDAARSPEGGTGLGLAICRSIAEAHDGGIRIESRLGRGTSVTVSLPAPRDDEGAPTSLAAATRESPRPDA